MPLIDVLRFAAIVVFGIGAGFMILTNFIAFQVLRPPKSLGFLWWHVTSISVAWLLVGGSLVYITSVRIGFAPIWTTYTALPGLLLFAIAQVIIFTIERSRLAAAQALRAAEERSQDAI